MADHSKPTTSSQYVNFVTELDARLDDITKWLAGGTSTNLPTGAVKWDTSGKKLVKYNGTTWDDLSDTYVFNTVDAVTLKSSGNSRVGTGSLSTWLTSYRAQEVYGSAVAANASGNGGYFSNIYLNTDSTYRYKFAGLPGAVYKTSTSTTNLHEWLVLTGNLGAGNQPSTEISALKINDVGALTHGGAVVAQAAAISDAPINLLNNSNFIWTIVAGTGTKTISFSNLTSYQSGWIRLVNPDNTTVSASANVKLESGVLTTLSTTGTYLLSYFVDGSNVYITASGALA